MTNRGRPTRLNQQLQDDLCTYLKGGNYIDTACALVDIHKTTLYNWMRRGEAEIKRLEENPKAKIKKKEAPYVDFFYAIARAMATAEASSVARIRMAGQKAVDGDWHADMEWLKRRFPERWGMRNQSIKVDADVKSVARRVDVRLTKEELDKLDAHEKAALWRDMIGGGDD